MELQSRVALVVLFAAGVGADPSATCQSATCEEGHERKQGSWMLQLRSKQMAAEADGGQCWCISKTLSSSAAAMCGSKSRDKKYHVLSENGGAVGDAVKSAFNIENGKDYDGSCSSNYKGSEDNTAHMGWLVGRENASCAGTTDDDKDGSWDKVEKDGYAVARCKNLEKSESCASNDDRECKSVLQPTDGQCWCISKTLSSSAAAMCGSKSRDKKYHLLSDNGGAIGDAVKSAFNIENGKDYDGSCSSNYKGSEDNTAHMGWLVGREDASCAGTTHDDKDGSWDKVEEDGYAVARCENLEDTESCASNDDRECKTITA